MEIDIEELFNDELRMLNWLVDEFEIPDDVFRECGSSYLWITADSSFERMAARSGKDATEHPRVPKVMMEKAMSDFERLCQSAPHIPRSALEAVSLAYSTFVYLTKNGKDIGGEDGGNLQSHLQALFAITTARGVAMGQVGMAAGEMQAVRSNALRKKKLSEAGAKGAVSRLQPYVELKSWALEKGEKLGASKAVARRLERQLPPHLTDVSDDPVRLIYETLLNRNKPS